MFFQGIRCGKCAHDRAQLTRETGGWVALVITLMLEPVQRVIRLSGSGTMSHGADPWPARIGHGGIRLVCKGKLLKKTPLQLHMHYTDRVAASHTQENGYTIKNLFQRAGGLQVVVVGSVSPLLLAALVVVQKLLQGRKCVLIRGARGLHQRVVNRHARQISGPTARLTGQAILFIGEGNFILLIG